MHRRPRPLRSAVVASRVALLLAAIPLPVAAAPGAAAAPAPVAQADPVATLREAEKQLRTAFRGTTVRADLERIGAGAIDYEELSRRSVGARWDGLAPADRTAIVKAQRALLEETYFSGLLRADPLFAFAVLGSSTTGAEADVKTVVQSGGQQVRVEYRLYRGKDRRWRIVDATVNGVAILAGYQELFAQLLGGGGVRRLVGSLEGQRKALIQMRSRPPTPTTSPKG